MQLPVGGIIVYCVYFYAMNARRLETKNLFLISHFAFRIYQLVVWLSVCMFVCVLSGTTSKAKCNKSGRGRSRGRGIGGSRERVTSSRANGNRIWRIALPSSNGSNGSSGSSGSSGSNRQQPSAVNNNIGTLAWLAAGLLSRLSLSPVSLPG